MKCKTCLLVAALAVAASSSASEWTGNESEDWFDSLNWTAGVPTAGTNSVRISTINPNPTEIDGEAAETGSNFGVGHNGTGELFIINGGTLSSTSATLGSQPAGNGSVTISGDGSSWQIASGNFDIGSFGSGHLEIVDGGLLQTTFSAVSRLGQQSAGTGSVIVAGDGSRWELQGNFEVGSTGSGQMTISDGGQVFFSSTSTLAQASAGNGELTISGAGSLLSGTRLHVGNTGTGLMQLFDGGMLELTGSGSPSNYRLIIGFNSGSEGTVIVGAPSGESPAAPGELLLTGGIGFGNGSGTLVFNHSGELEMGFPVTGSGLLQFENGTSLFAGAAFDYGGSTFIAEGAVFGASGQFGPIENQGRFVVAPGSTDPVAIDGDFVLGPGALVDIDFGPGPLVNQLQVSGQADLEGGTLRFTLLPGDYGNLPLDGIYPILTAEGGIIGGVPPLAANPNAFELFIDGDTLYVEVFDRVFEDRFEN